MIRPATSADALAIAGIWNAIIRDTALTFTSTEKTEAEIIEAIARRPAFLVAETAGIVVGFACLGSFRSGPGYAHLQEHTIYLSSPARGARVGRALMVALEARARDLGHKALIAGISAANPAGIAFHAALGFAEVGRVPRAGRKAGAWHDLILMHKFL